MDTPSFHQQVRQLLTSSTKSQAMLAEYIGTSPSNLSRALRGERPLDPELLHKIAEFFDLSVPDLVQGTEHEDHAVAGRATVERQTYEDLLARLREAMCAAEAAEAQLAAERAERAQLEAEHSTQEEALAAAQERAQELEQCSARDAATILAADLQRRAMEVRLMELEAANSRLTADLEQAQGRLRFAARDARALTTANHELRRELAAKAGQVGSLEGALARATLQVTRNYDAWVQAESHRQQLLKQLQQAPGDGALLLAGVIGLGAGVLAAGGSGRK